MIDYTPAHGRQKPLQSKENVSNTPLLKEDELYTFIVNSGSQEILQTLHSRRYFTTSSGILGKVFN